MSQVAFDIDLDDGGVPTLTVGELGDAISSALRRRFDEGVWVRGEIDRISSDKNGNAYFDLLDDTEGVNAKISVVCFRMVRERLRGMLNRYGLNLAGGLKIRIHGQLDYWAPGGRLSLRMDAIDPQFTLGEIALARQALVAAMRADGTFDAQRALRLAESPRVIGVVTSVGTAAWHDFAHQLNGSGYGFQLKVCDVKVQGEWAVEMVAAAIAELGAQPGIEAIVVIRGGGARSELATFDAEPIARAIAAASVPVLTGLGHQTDRAVADEVAHSSYKTPTACAEALIERVRGFHERTERAWAQIEALANEQLHREIGRLGMANDRIADRTQRAVTRAVDRLDRLARSLPVAARATLYQQRAHVDTAMSLTGVHARRHVSSAARAIDSAETRVRLLDPVNTLARGYSITRDAATGRTVRDPRDVSPGVRLITAVAGGEIESTVQ